MKEENEGSLDIIYFIDWFIESGWLGFGVESIEDASAFENFNFANKQIKWWLYFIGQKAIK